MQQRIVVAIDGPSGSGKSSVSRAVARHFGFDYLDTGAMYRAFAWWSLQGHRNMRGCPLAMSTNPDVVDVQVGDTDITAAIRGPEVTAAVSEIARDPDIRSIAVEQQRAIMRRAERGIVVEGRDITSVVAPDADVRIFLTADLAARESRRAAEFAHDAHTASAVAAAVAERDAIDSSRSHSPLVKVDGVTEIDATHMSLDEVITTVIGLVDAARADGQ